MFRRRFIQYGLSSLAIAPLSAWAQTENTDAAKVTAGVDVAKRFTVPVHINGQGPFNFVVDTGADQTVICDEVAKSLGLTRGPSVIIHGIVQSKVSETVSVTKLSMGDIVKSHLRLPTLPRALLQCDGFLGMDVLDGNRVIFNFDQQTLTVTRPRSNFMGFPARPDEAVIALHGKKDHLRSTNCRVDGVHAAAFIDTGAEVSAGNSSLFKELMEKNHARSIGTTKVLGVTGGEMQGQVTDVKDIQLQDLTFTHCSLIVADFEVFSVWGLKNTPAMLIGMNYLRQFSQVSIDYGRGELRFELANRKPVTECACTSMPKV